jgi:hypothetical protein
MSTYNTRKTADYSPLAVHFTKEKKFVRSDLIRNGDPLFNFKRASAMDRLLNILKTKTICPSPMPWLPNNPRAVCFTECIWDALIPLAEVYSSYGVVFAKSLIFSKGGGPALYVRGDQLKRLIDAQVIPSDLEPFIQPFDPEAVLKQGVKIDYLHEREWRLPSEFTFEYSDLEYVLVRSIKEATAVVHEIGAQRLPEKKLIPLDTYEEIRKSWGK